MPVLHRSVAALRVSGDELDPEEITRALGCMPTASQRKGEVRIGKYTQASVIARIGQWRLDATPTEPADLTAQVGELVGKLTSDLTVWKTISAKYRIDLYCGWFMKGGNEGVKMPPETIKSLSSRFIALDVDIYGPDGDA